MNKCPNCGATVTCSCQYRTASNGTKCCINCILTYENKIAQEKQNKPQGITPVHTLPQ
jgi:hypothetical protein